MLTDSERFAFTMRRHHAFASTGNAYDAVQCDEAIRTGDTLVMLAEEVVGVASPKPFAVTQAHGNPHALSTPREGETLADLARSLHSARPTSNTPPRSPGVSDFRSTRRSTRGLPAPRAEPARFRAAG